jgi:hypothetical protein
MDGTLIPGCLRKPGNSDIDRLAPDVDARLALDADSLRRGLVWPM